MSKAVKTNDDLWSKLEVIVDLGFDIGISRDDIKKRKPYSVVFAGSEGEKWEEEDTEVYEGRGSTLPKAVQDALDEFKIACEGEDE